MSTIFFNDTVDFIYNKNKVTFLPTGEIDLDSVEYVTRQRTLACHFRNNQYVLVSTIRNPKEMDNKKLAKKVLMGRIEKYFLGRDTRFLVSFNSIEELRDIFLTDSLEKENIEYILGGQINLLDLDLIINSLEEKISTKTWDEFVNS